MVMYPNVVAGHLYENNDFVIEGIRKKRCMLEGENIYEFYRGKYYKQCYRKELCRKWS